MQPTLTNLKLNHEWMIGELIEKENERHAMVYSIVISETGHLAEELEAHVFALDEIEPKLRKHRQRCIKRMERRTKLKLEVEKNTIIVITTSQMENISGLESEAEPHSQTTDGQHETHNGSIPIGKLKQRTLYQLEVQRIRQKERRQAKRRAKTGQGGEKTTDDEDNMTRHIDQDNSVDGKNEFSMIVSLIDELLDAWNVWEQIPAVYASVANHTGGSFPRWAFDQYMLQTADALKTLEKLESFLKLRRSEIVSMRRQRAKK